MRWYMACMATAQYISKRETRVGYRTGDHKGPPPASSPRSPLLYGEAARTVRVSLSANLLIGANIYILFIVRSATFMRRLFPFDYTFIIASRHSSFLAANSVGRENILLSRVAKK